VVGRDERGEAEALPERGGGVTPPGGLATAGDSGGGGERGGGGGGKDSGVEGKARRVRRTGGEETLKELKGGGRGRDLQGVQGAGTDGGIPKRGESKEYSSSKEPSGRLVGSRDALEEEGKGKRGLSRSGEEGGQQVGDSEAGGEETKKTNKKGKGARRGKGENKKK
jgi:hypothetical protein